MTEQRGSSPHGAHAARHRRPGERQDHPGGPHPRGAHGSSPASWSVVAIVLAGFVVWGIGMVLGPNWTLVWIGTALVPLGLLVGAVLSKAGLGAPRH